MKLLLALALAALPTTTVAGLSAAIAKTTSDFAAMKTAIGAQ